MATRATAVPRWVHRRPALGETAMTQAEAPDQDETPPPTDAPITRIGVWLLDRSDGWVQSGVQARVVAQALLLLRLARTVVDLGGVERAVELRYGVLPSRDEPWKSRAWC